MKNRTIHVKGATVTITSRHEQDYIALTDMVRNFDGGSALIEQWLKNKDTVLFLGVWEQINNPDFNSLEFEGIRNEAGRNSFFLSAKKWIEATGAILESINAVLIHQGLSASERLTQLNTIAITQMRSLVTGASIKAGNPLHKLGKR